MDTSHQYSLISSDEKHAQQPSLECRKEEKQLSRRCFHLFVILTIVTVPLLLITAFFAGKNYAQVGQLGIVPVKSSVHDYPFGLTYTQAPSNETNAAWKGIFPWEQGVSFRHPTLAPEKGAFAVYHQLHCLDGLRHGYWNSFTAAKEGKMMQDGDYPDHGSPLHVRHCLDYLRQSIMCHSDTNIEPYVEGKGYKGWGEHQCRKYEDVAAWVKETQERYGGFDEYPDLAGSDTL